MMKGKRISEYAEIFFTFAKIGLFTFGGGLAMMPMLQKELVQKRGWITDEDLIDYYAIGQSTPGIVAVNVSTFAGYRRMGVAGGIIGTCGIVFPSLVIIMVLAGLISSVSEYPRVQDALDGINVAVAALMTSVLVRFSKKTVRSLFSALMMLVSFCLIYFLDVPSVAVIIASVTAGVIITAVRLHKNGAGHGGQS